MGLTRYLKAAFLWHWNLLAFGGGMAFALLSGRPDVLCPVVLAGEVAYLGLLGTHPRFQKYVEAQEAKAARPQEKADPEQAVKRLLAALPSKLLQRFDTLRSQCQELRQIAQDMRSLRQAESSPAPLDEMHLEGLDRLLWIYLRLLYTQFSLERFLAQTSEQHIETDIRNLESRLKALPADSEDPQRQRIRRSLEDNLETSRTRLANFQKARDQMELVKLEIDRLENKIRSLSELAVNRQEPDYIAGQVDQVVSGMVQTERTMSDLQFITGLDAVDESVPRLVQRQTTRAER